MHRVLQSILLTSALILLSCSGNKTTEVLHTFPADDLSGLVNSSLVSFDSEMSADSAGSIRIVVDSPMTVPLYEVENVDVDDCRLIYRAKLRTEGFDGQVYLEMWCYFPDLGEYFSRNLDQTIGGTHAWTSREAIFFLKPGQVPNRVLLNVGADGIGTIWIDQIELLKAPL